MPIRRRQRKGMLPKEIFKEVLYTEGPPALEQCGTCVHAIVFSFDPLNACPHRMAMKTTHIVCDLSNNTWQEGMCKDFQNGERQIPTHIPLAQNK
ncbi:MAG: hypothetical protein HYZ69_00315 [Candidatus Colwellbacteria bacterium]|nr:hypothetical protein [Candidatus Colwellbacteria bacterium]